MEKFARRLLYMSLTFLFMAVFATIFVPEGSAERVVGLIVVGLNIVMSVVITIYLRKQYKKEEQAVKKTPAKNRIMDLIGK